LARKATLGVDRGGVFLGDLRYRAGTRDQFIMAFPEHGNAAGGGPNRFISSIHDRPFSCAAYNKIILSLMSDSLCAFL
jgi:hypothetical protein